VPAYGRHVFGLPTYFQHHVDGGAFARSLAQALQLNGDTRLLLRFETLWRLGARRLNDIRVAFLFTPNLDRLDAATTILDSIADQSRSIPFCLLVASDIGGVRLLQRGNVVIRLGDIAVIAPDGRLTVDEAQLLLEIFPQTGRRVRGRPPGQRTLILPLLRELHGEGVVIDDSNETCRVVQNWFEKRYPGAKVPDTRGQASRAPPSRYPVWKMKGTCRCFSTGKSVRNRVRKD
jgi:hypothetical protein